MAESRKKVERIEVKTYEDKVVGVTLELSLEEAATIYDVLCRVGGSPEDTRRKHTKNVYGALGKHLKDFSHTRATTGAGVVLDMADSGSIYFK